MIRVLKSELGAWDHACCNRSQKLGATRVEVGVGCPGEDQWSDVVWRLRL